MALITQTEQATVINLHKSGWCTPCRAFASGAGCPVGATCTFCHMPHDKQRRGRPSKTARMRCKRVATLLSGFAHEEGALDDAVDQLTAHCPIRPDYMDSIMRSMFRKEECMHADEKKKQNVESEDDQTNCSL
eukprot:NODE_17934_length_919_cov_3.657828.p2 GENE.NODE_17934_length_919_cov_3.657828~~NODE_17934_length_919_cov_3.657828.p2  ORF type:complete len:133 (+),score=15.41 NODE_17934_length_919_cov_3.657828:387-785(+)